MEGVTAAAHPERKGECRSQTAQRRNRQKPVTATRLEARDLSQVLQHLTRIGVARCRILFQAARDDPAEGHRHCGRKRRRFRVENGKAARDGRLRREGELAGEHLVQDGPEAEHVRALIRGLAPDLLGRHVPDRAEDRALLSVRLRRGERLGGSRHHRRHQLGDAEVEDLQPALLGEEEVLRLQVAMDDAFLVRGREALRELQGVAVRLMHRQSSFPQSLAQCDPVQQLGDDVRAALVRPDIVHVEDVGVIERAGGARFLFEAAQLSLIVQAGGEHLDGDVAPELAVVGDEDAPHPAAADLFRYSVALIDPGKARCFACWDRRSHLLGLAHAAPGATLRPVGTRVKRRWRHPACGQPIRPRRRFRRSRARSIFQGASPNGGGA